MYIRANPRDNVGIIVHPEGVAAGAGLPGGIAAREWIPQSHKIALLQLEAGQPVLRYGQIIGFANRTIPAGSWVREEMIDMPAPPPRGVSKPNSCRAFPTWTMSSPSSGRKKTWAEHWGLANALSRFNPGPVT